MLSFYYNTYVRCTFFQYRLTGFCRIEQLPTYFTYLDHCDGSVNQIRSQQDKVRRNLQLNEEIPKAVLNRFLAGRNLEQSKMILDQMKIRGEKDPQQKSFEYVKNSLAICLCITNGKRVGEIKNMTEQEFSKAYGTTRNSEDHLVQVAKLTRLIEPNTGR